MPNLPLYSGDPKLVVAFDIGTTFSGISYCILERNQPPEILGVTRFPGQARAGDAKVPSLLYYDNCGNVKAAGAEVVTENVIDDALNEGWVRAEWWKLHLRPNHLASSINKNDDLPPLPPGKTGVHVLTDFIRYLFQCARTYIEERHLAFSWSSVENSIEYIFTHPNGWEGVPQQLYRRAIEFAGLVPSTPEGRSRVHMLTEGEASLHFCVANLINVDLANQATPQGVVVIDAGGGTVDLSMFSMTSNPISCEEMAPAECRLQGSVFVTRRAKVLLERKLEGWEHSSPDEIAEYTREFDQSTKLVVKSDQEPAYLRVGGRRTNVPKYNIAFGKLKLTGEEATGLFNESFDAIVSAFEQQQKAAETQITMGFFVGGLSTNDWMWSRLQAYFEDKKVKISRPDNHINKAVANGAVLSHVDRENHKVTSRVARATYGVVCAVPVKPNDEEHVRRKHRWETDPTGECFVPDFYEAKLLKGDKIGEDMDFRESFSLTESDPAQFTTQTVRLECYRGNIRKPTWVDQDPSLFFTFCTISADLSKAVNDLTEKKDHSGEIFYQLDYDVIVYFGLTELKAFLGWKTRDGECKIPAEVKFDSEDDDRKDEDQSRQPRKQYQIIISKADLDQFWTNLSNTSSQSPVPQSIYSEPPKDASSILRLLELTFSLCAEKDRTIASLTTEDAKKTQQIIALHGDNESLHRDLGAANSKILEELGSMQKELQTKAASIEEKDGTIATLAAEVAQLKQFNVERTKEITNLHADHEKLQRDFSALSETTEFQRRQQYEVQSNVQYGVVCALPVDKDDEEHVRRKNLWEVDPSGEYYVPGHFESKLRVGADSREEKEFRDAFSLIRRNPAGFGDQRVHILCYRGRLLDPKWVDDDESSFSPLCTIHVDLSEAVKDLIMTKDSSSGVYYQLDYDVIVSFGRTDIHAEVCWISGTGERRMPAKVSFEG